MFISAETQKLMRLLSQVILADGHVYETEMDALVQGVRELGLKDLSGAVLSAENVHQWFDAYLQDLNESWSTAPKDVILTQLILSLAEWPRKQEVVNVLKKISLADSDFHAEEKLLISIVKAYWQFDGLDAPNSKIVV